MRATVNKEPSHFVQNDPRQWEQQLTKNPATLYKMILDNENS